MIRTVDESTYIFVPLAKENSPARAAIPWTLEKFIENGEATRVLQATKTSIAFDGGTLRKSGAVPGSTGCREYSADCVNRPHPNGQEGPNFEDFTVTRKLCRSPEGAMEQERSYLAALEDVKGYHQKIDGRLYLGTGDGRKLVFAGSG